ncbi:outer membrane beta-barrel protein [Chitinophaga sp. Cy-1792]|uniref:outer membrane beta-barrel protein n=1 Tax=Chitinophaga sp. Cy-1792 TaxID=2608339 RepID=UPI001423B0A4|nr:outer membrane beta-barrel protein [Chitinophaga sp. Cy-1792]NIG53845.1 outer membrane beta-barrel protein [Chitinophaga sp. Cy-1792]
MKRVATLMSIMLGLTLHVIAQNSIQGIVTDGTRQEVMINTAVILIKARDSMLVQAVRTGNDGRFQINKIDTGKYIVLISYANYADYTEFVYLQTAQQQIDLGKIAMTTKAHLLQEVVVRKELGAIIIKGDTTEFVADSFRLQPNASVEELLARLPGLQVDKDGNITAQGAAVKKVLVDGEEFFGDDPTLVTRNLRADMIDKVQVYEKKSDMAVATGINDGKQEKTINLQLKENSKRGMFGKISVGGGLQGYFEEQAMINFFRGKQKVSVYGTLGNTGRIGLGWQDNEKLSVQRDESVTKDNELDSWSGNYEGQGIPLAQTGGFHFNDRWSEDKQAINLNYKVGNLMIDGESNTIAQNNLPGSIIYSSTNQAFKNNIFKNKLLGEYEIKADSSTRIKVNVSGILNHKTTDNQYHVKTYDGDSSLLNTGRRQLSNSSDLGNINTMVMIERSMKKKGRKLALFLHENYINENSAGIVKAQSDFYYGVDKRDSTALLDQRKTAVSKSLYLDGKIVYTEPLSRRVVMVWNYGLSVNASNADMNAYNKSAEGFYNQPDSAFSNSYAFSQLINQGGIAFSVNSNKVHFNFGTDAGLTNWTQTNHYTGNSNQRSFVNWYPSADLTYVFRMQQSIGVYYNGTTKMPAINQVQPVLNNTDPLNVYVGNPALDPYYTNVMGIRYNTYQPLSGKYLFSNFNYSFSGNQITTNTITDLSGKNIYSYMNVGGNNRYWGYLGLGKKMDRFNANAGINLGVNGERGVNFSNGVRNILHYHNYNAEIYANQYLKDRYDVSLALNAAWNTSASSLQQQAPVNYWTGTISPALTVFLPGKLQLHTEVKYYIRQRTNIFSDNLNVLLCNAWIGKKFLKEDALLVKVSGNDLLNRNKGFNRFVGGSSMVQNSYTTVQRFFLLSVTWNFIQRTAVQNGNPSSK